MDKRAWCREGIEKLLYALYLGGVAFTNVI